MPKCETCRFWKLQFSGSPYIARYGICRIAPPSMAGNGEGRWPRTDADSWCGSHKSPDWGGFSLSGPEAKEEGV